MNIQAVHSGSHPPSFGQMDKPNNRISSSSFLSSSPYFMNWVSLQELRLMIWSFSCHFTKQAGELLFASPGHKSSKAPFPKDGFMN